MRLEDAEVGQELNAARLVLRRFVEVNDARVRFVAWINGVPVRRLLKKDGKDLSPDELKKENERIDKEAAKARERRDKADADGKETDPRGHDEITVSRLLELGRFTNPRRARGPVSTP